MGAQVRVDGVRLGVSSGLGRVLLLVGGGRVGTIEVAETLVDPSFAAVAGSSPFVRSLVGLPDKVGDIDVGMSPSISPLFAGAVKKNRNEMLEWEGPENGLWKGVSSGRAYRAVHGSLDYRKWWTRYSCIYLNENRRQTSTHSKVGGKCIIRHCAN